MPSNVLIFIILALGVCTCQQWPNPAPGYPPNQNPPFNPNYPANPNPGFHSNSNPPFNPNYPANPTPGYPPNPNPPFNPNYPNYPNYPQSEPLITKEKSFEFTPAMEKDAVEFLKTAYRTRVGGNECVILRDLFTTKYPDYIWHVAKAKAYAIRFIKSIDLMAGAERYVLFATKK